MYTCIVGQLHSNIHEYNGMQYLVLGQYNFDAVMMSFDFRVDCTYTLQYMYIIQDNTSIDWVTIFAVAA